jgi:non-ribosomal peptide synthetase component F
VQYADFAAWQREWLAGEVLERQLAYWRGKLAGAPPLLRLPADRPRPAEQSFRGADLFLLLPAAEHQALQALARREGATPFMVLLAGLAGVLARHAEQREVVVGTPIAARPRGTEGLIGLFINYLALRVDVEPGGDFRARLRAVRQTTLDAYAHQDVPFARVVDELRVERVPGATPVFQVLLNVMSYEEGEVAFPGLRVEPRGHAGEQTSKFDLTLYASQAPGGLLLRLVYSTDLFDAGRMAGLLSDLRATLAEAAGEPEP